MEPGQLNSSNSDNHMGSNRAETFARHFNNVPPGSRKSKIIKAVTQDEISEILECPVCYDLIAPPVYICLNGHNVCSDCRQNVNSCPLCRTEFSPFTNAFVERLLEKCVLSCKFIAAGCPEMFSGFNLQYHVGCCNFRLVTCPDCDQLIEFHKFLEHLHNDKVPFYVGAECATGYEIAGADILGGIVWEPTWIQVFEQNFFAILECNGIHWWFYVKMFGPPEEAEKFHCDIILWSKTKPNETVKYSGPVHSFREIVLFNNCLVTQRPIIESFGENGGIDVNIKIYRYPRIVEDRFTHEQVANKESPSMLPSGIHVSSESMVLPEFGQLAIQDQNLEVDQPGGQSQESQVPRESRIENGFRNTVNSVSVGLNRRQSLRQLTNIPHRGASGDMINTIGGQAVDSSQSFQGPHNGTAGWPSTRN